MAPHRPASLAFTALTTVALAALAGCSAAAPDPAPTATTPAPVPSATTPALGPDVAFVITGELASPDGATTFAFEMTVGVPTQATAAQDEAAFAASVHCPPDVLGAPSFPDPAYVHVTVATTPLTGDPAGADVVVRGMDQYAATWDGDYVTAQAYCAPPFLRPVPGVATAIGVVRSHDDAGPDAWLPTAGGYGVSAFAIDPGTNDAEPYTATACTLQFGPDPSAAAGLVRVDAGLGCSFGFADS